MKPANNISTFPNPRSTVKVTTDTKLPQRQSYHKDKVTCPVLISFTRHTWNMANFKADNF